MQRISCDANIRLSEVTYFIYINFNTVKFKM